MPLNMTQTDPFLTAWQLSAINPNQMEPFVGKKNQLLFHMVHMCITFGTK